MLIGEILHALSFFGFVEIDETYGVTLIKSLEYEAHGVMSDIRTTGVYREDLEEAVGQTGIDLRPAFLTNFENELSGLSSIGNKIRSIFLK
ncbi:hypothetical protein PGT21_015559 [Puccinia graminis f. sp. tritici]|uniref:Uncharacterized protein n=1 Tax=Puccinia graminis f. sp. tritici TaxID=56615 RepID=A0A5B0PG74_PUCGR|nr:hypothetical protein PGTUg99_013535 [Puccinia graminis f. sp. tritici]KAA1105683.1 hypothetical protein PGT21_015559 [Puccinia graminis f. sp. tritici]